MSEAKGYINLSPEQRDGRDGIRIEFGFNYLVKKEGDMYAGYIPAYKIYYSAPSLEEARRRAEIMVKSFYDYWNDQQNFKRMILEIHKLGFKSHSLHDLTIKNLINNKINKAKLRSIDGSLPNGFDNPDVISENSESTMAVAV